MVNHDVETEDLETKTVFDIVRLARAEQVIHMRLSQTHRLDYDLIDLVEHSLLGHLAIIGANFVEYELVGALATYIICVLAFILDKVARLLIDRVVSQVHAKVIQIRRGWTLVLLRRKPCKTIFVNIDAKRCDAVYKHVDAQIKLEAINQVGFVHVPLDNHVLNHTGH